MKPILRLVLSRLLIVTMAALPFTARAGLIATDEAVAPVSAYANANANDSERAKVRGFLARADVLAQLQAHGVTPQDAQARVDALTDAEVQQLAGNIDNLPAGAISGPAAVVGVTILLVLVTYAIVRAFYPQR